MAEENPNAFDAAPSLAAEPQQEQRHTTLEGRAVRVISYAVRDRFAARIEDTESNEVVGRARGATRTEAEGMALAAASVRLGLVAARSSLRSGIAQLAGQDAVLPATADAPALDDDSA